jgi:hypothetical protein
MPIRFPLFLWDNHITLRLPYGITIEETELAPILFPNISRFYAREEVWCFLPQKTGGRRFLRRSEGILQPAACGLRLTLAEDIQDVCERHSRKLT